MVEAGLDHPPSTIDELWYQEEGPLVEAARQWATPLAMYGPIRQVTI